MQLQRKPKKKHWFKHRSSFFFLGLKVYVRKSRGLQSWSIPPWPSGSVCTSPTLEATWPSPSFLNMRTCRFRTDLKYVHLLKMSEDSKYLEFPTRTISQLNHGRFVRNVNIRFLELQDMIWVSKKHYFSAHFCYDAPFVNKNLFSFQKQILKVFLYLL